MPEQKDPNDRIGWGGWGGCANSEGAISGSWDREIGGIFFVVDMTKKKVLRVTDYGVTPSFPTTGIYDGMGGEALPNTKPILVTQPAGPSFTIDKGLVSWQHWRFRFRLDPRSGPVLNLVSIEDSGKLRSVMYEGSLSEMYVPYQDPEETWNSHVFLDGGEYFMNTGLGMIKPLVAGIDCPEYATFFSAFFYKEDGSPSNVPKQPACSNVPSATLRGVTVTRTEPSVVPRASWFCARSRRSATTITSLTGASVRTARSRVRSAQRAFSRSSRSAIPTSPTAVFRAAL